MNPGQFLAQIKRGATPAATLLLGTEAYERRRIKAALVATVLETAVTQHDLAERSLAEVVDDARALSLFAAERIIWVTSAEAALPKGKTSGPDGDSDGDGEPVASGGAAVLGAYLKDPTPGVALVFEAIRFDFEGEDKRKQERVRKFYAGIRDVVELQKYSVQEARAETESLARKAGCRLAPDALDLLVEALGADIARIAVEIEKLALYAGDRVIEVDDIPALVPDARATTIFALVNALGRRDRVRALGVLDTLTREGAYLPLALAFLSTQFRMALVAREAGLKSSQQIQSHFQRMGVQMWGSRAEQVYQTVTRFSKPQLERAVSLIYQADKGMRDTRPDDRIVMEQFITRLVQ
ncbi:MAG TPA: DNA polymerase III subunit delta [Candidatus Acidoferrales bacterium]|nr:DNA polymerase III subunit delta [Candidatus Acidoferrales bacterium]